MKVLGIIPARYLSTRFPGKPLVDLKGKSMIQRVYEGASRCEGIQQIIVATDDHRIFDHVVGFGGQAMMTQVTHTTGTERCFEVAQKLPDFDVYVNIQGDEPLVNPIQLSQLLSLFSDSFVEIGTLAIPVQDETDLGNANRIKLVVNHVNEALCFSRSSLPSMLHSSAFVPLKHIGLYAFRKQSLQAISLLPSCEWEKSESLEQLRWLYNGYKIKVFTTDIETPNIDTPEDISKVLQHL
jgi:3-deoxy-manno-octulosonate cytidylyltransferase (CMP-KDO synthetase)